MIGLLHRVQQFADGVAILTDWLGSGANVVDHELAQTRANICIKCPMNVKESFVTEAIADAVRKQVEIKNKLELRVDGEKLLHSCLPCGCYTRLKIHVPLKNIIPSESERINFHPSCWLLSEKL